MLVCNVYLIKLLHKLVVDLPLTECVERKKQTSLANLSEEAGAGRVEESLFVVNLGLVLLSAEISLL